MAQGRNGGISYSTDDLIKLAQLGNFGTYSPVIARALMKLKIVEVENKELKEIISNYESIDDIKKDYEKIEPEGDIVTDFGSLGQAKF